MTDDLSVMVIGDVHLNDRPPSVRTETYAEDILAKLEWCIGYANQHADVVLQLGDIFHTKAPHRTSHWLVQRTAEVFRSFDGRVLIVPGNHDLSQDRLESLPSQPLGTLALTPNITLLDGVDDETGIWGIPYLDNQEIFLQRWNEACTSPHDVRLIATHAPIFPRTDLPQYEHYNAFELPGTGSIPVAYGHIHDPHGFYYYMEQGTWFCNNGAISRGSLHEETLKREPKVTMFWDGGTMGADDCPFTSVDVPHRPAADVFRLVEVAEKKGQEQKLDEFLESVGEVSLTSLSMEEIVSHADSTQLSAKAKAELKDIIESVL